jgi:hypothetical protein
VRLLSNNTQSLTLPLELGEAGRGRTLVKIGTGGPNIDPNNCGFITGLDGRVIITKDRGQSGVLWRCNTKTSYIRGASGGCVLIFGDATELACGHYAFGDAGRVGGGPDYLWHVKGPSIFWIAPSRGEVYYGVFDGRDFHYGSKDDLSQWCATDMHPTITALARDYVASVVRAHIKDPSVKDPNPKTTEALTNALALLDRLENEVVATSPETTHFWESGIEVALCTLGLTRQAPGIESRGLALHEKMLIPGEHTFAAFSMSPGGGKRWSLHVIEEVGVRHVAEDERSSTQLFQVEVPTWRVVWEQWRDGEPVRRWIADAAGITQIALGSDSNHRGTRAAWGDPYSVTWL